jgi:hypothetical protein
MADRLTDLVAMVRLELERAARHQETRTYTAPGQAADPPLHAQNPLLAKALRQLVHDDTTAKRPLTASLAVRSKTRRPGPGFYRSARDAGHRVGQDTHRRATLRTIRTRKGLRPFNGK